MKASDSSLSPLSTTAQGASTTSSTSQTSQKTLRSAVKDITKGLDGVLVSKNKKVKFPNDDSIAQVISPNISNNFEEYRKYKQPFCPTGEASHPKSSHLFSVQIPIFAIEPAQIAQIRFGLAAKVSG